MKNEQWKTKNANDVGRMNNSSFFILHFSFNKRESSRRAFTFIEVLVAVSVLAIVLVGIMSAYAKTTSTRTAARGKIVGTFLGNELMETIRNLPYTSVGVDGSVPTGVLARTQRLVRDGISFTVTTTVRNIDDPFDGTLGSSTKPDMAPADYKLVEENITCDGCINFSPIVMTTTVAPKNMESPDSGGGLLAKVFDASGQAVSGADVHVVGTLATSTVVIDDRTDTAGQLLLVGLPPATQNYALTVSKSGYTTDRSYHPGSLGASTPVKPDATVALGALTSVGLSIDHSSSLSIKTQTSACLPIPGVGVHMRGDKKIGINPDMYSFDQAYTTDESGQKRLAALTWDNYALSLTDSLYDLAGTLPFSPLSLLPGANQDFAFILKSKLPEALLVTAKDAATDLPITNATVVLSQSGTSYTKTTGRGALSQSDWSGGSGQATSTGPVETKYFWDDGNAETSNPAGVLSLRRVGNEYARSAVLTSSTFDTGTESTFYALNWSPATAPASTTVRFQIATNNDGGTWNFVGPSGGATDYYATSSLTISPDHNGDRYLRYRIFLDTASTTMPAPSVADVSFVYSTNCTPAGEVFWNGLPSGTWTLSVSHPDYQLAPDENLSLDAGWQEKVVTLTHR